MLHLACQSLRPAETKQTLVFRASPVPSLNYVAQSSVMHMVVPDGAGHLSNTWANDYARGEAVRAVVVKTQRQAAADGDTVRAVVRGTRTNQDGRTTGITVPSGRAQEALIRSTCDIACPSPADAGGFKAFVTGTWAGDSLGPIQADRNSLDEKASANLTYTNVLSRGKH